MRKIFILLFYVISLTAYADTSQNDCILTKATRDELITGPLHNIVTSNNYQPTQFVEDLGVCNYALCNAYKAYLLLPSQPDLAYRYLQSSIMQIKNAQKICSGPIFTIDKNLLPRGKKNIRKRYSSQLSISELIVAINQTWTNNVNDQLGMPFIIIKHTPHTLAYMNYRYAFIENGKPNNGYIDARLTPMVKLDQLDTATTKVMGPFLQQLIQVGKIGSLYLDTDAVLANQRREVLLAPDLLFSADKGGVNFNNANVEKILASIHHDFYPNANDYQQFLQTFNAAATELNTYYQQTDLKNYCPYVKNILARYIDFKFHAYDDFT